MAEINYHGTGQVEGVLRGELEHWLKKTLMDLTGEAQRRAPKGPPRMRNGQQYNGGDLRASGHWEILGPDHGRVVFDVPYAAVQHEHMEYRHTDGEAKYLENPAREKGHLYQQDLERRLARRVGR